MPRPPRTSVTFTVRGHPAFAATHAKTLEFTRDPEISRRATCVLGTASDHVDAELLRLRGEVEVELACGGESDRFRATVTPFYCGADSLVFRRGPALRARTFAGGATTGAAGIDRALVSAAASRDAEITVTITETGAPAPPGALFVVALPIGAGNDLAPRARRVLGAADTVLAEDTRRFRDLARRTGLEVAGRVESLHEHNEAERVAAALAALGTGARVALVSDAGTPLCSDPGYLVVRAAAEADIPVVPVPGPSAVLAAVSAAGLPVDRFVYVGYHPRRAAARRAELRRLAAGAVTFVCHESPHRVAAFLDDLVAECPDWQICVGREMTKVFEEFHRGSPAELVAGLAGREPRGEHTFVVAPPPGADAPAVESAGIDERLVRALLAEGVSPRTIATALAALPGVSRRDAYARVLELAGRA
ncbi:MAG: DUF371 domain-containing protein [Actinomycetota bacterium]